MGKPCEACGTTDDPTEPLIDGRRLCLECLAESYGTLVVKNANLKEKLVAIREENRKLRDAWPSDISGSVYANMGKWVIDETDIADTRRRKNERYNTRDEAINAAAGITQAADAAKGGE